MSPSSPYFSFLCLYPTPDYGCLSRWQPKTKAFWFILGRIVDSMVVIRHLGVFFLAQYQFDRTMRNWDVGLWWGSCSATSPWTTTMCRSQNTSKILFNLTAPPTTPTQRVWCVVKEMALAFRSYESQTHWQAPSRSYPRIECRRLRPRTTKCGFDTHLFDEKLAEIKQYTSFGNLKATNRPVREPSPNPRKKQYWGNCGKIVLLGSNDQLGYQDETYAFELNAPPHPHDALSHNLARGSTVRIISGRCGIWSRFINESRDNPNVELLTMVYANRHRITVTTSRNIEFGKDYMRIWRTKLMRRKLEEALIWKSVASIVNYLDEALCFNTSDDSSWEYRSLNCSNLTKFHFQAFTRWLSLLPFHIDLFWALTSHIYIHNT